MMSMSAEILDRGRDLARELRSEGRKADAQVVDALLKAAEVAEGKAPYLTTGQVARRVGISRQTVVNWVSQGLLPGVRLGGRTMIPVTVFERFARLEGILDEMDAERAPGEPDEVAAVVHRGREGWTWPDRDD